MNGTANAALNIPLKEDVAAMRVVLTKKRMSGWIDRVSSSAMPLPNPDGSRGNVAAAPPDNVQRRSNDARLEGVRASMIIQPTNELTITPTYLYQGIRLGAPDNLLHRHRDRRNFMRQLGALSVAAVAGLIHGPAAAHHSFALFDQTKTDTIKGVVSRFDWSNPHVTIYVDVPGSPAKRYKVEGASVNALARQGWKHNSLKVGDQAEVSFHPLRAGGALGGLLIEVKTGSVTLKAGG